MRQTKEDLVILTKTEYEALARELARSHMLNLRYQASCTCKIINRKRPKRNYWGEIE